MQNIMAFSSSCVHANKFPNAFPKNFPEIRNGIIDFWFPTFLTEFRRDSPRNSPKNLFFEGQLDGFPILLRKIPDNFGKTLRNPLA